MAVLAIGVTITSLVISGAIQNMRGARDRVIATNLAREGVEAVRNIRDTNWLKFSNNRRNCWNHFPGDTILLDICGGVTPIFPGDYIVYKNDEFRWKLDSTDQAGEDATMLTRVDIDLNTDSDLDGESDNDLDIYNHSLTTDTDPLGSSVQDTLFKRTITIEYLENTPDAGTPPSSNTPPEESINTAAEWGTLSATEQSNLNRIRITSIVNWQGANDAIHSVELKTILTDYLGRTQLSG